MSEEDPDGECGIYSTVASSSRGLVSFLCEYVDYGKSPLIHHPASSLSLSSVFSALQPSARNTTAPPTSLPRFGLQPLAGASTSHIHWNESRGDTNLSLTLVDCRNPCPVLSQLADFDMAGESGRVDRVFLSQRPMSLALVGWMVHLSVVGSLIRKIGLPPILLRLQVKNRLDRLPRFRPIISLDSHPPHSSFPPPPQIHSFLSHDLPDPNSSISHD